MRKIVCSLLVALALPSAASAAIALQVDQSFTEPTSARLAMYGCRLVAQTYTAGRSGTLQGVSLDVTGWRESRLLISIRTMAAGAPTNLTLGEKLLGSNSAHPPRVVNFPQPIAQTAGTRYAIVAEYVPTTNGVCPSPGEQQGWWKAAAGNLYAGGRLLVQLADGTWIVPPSGGYDAHFQTFVG